ncbi:MAG TPA: CHASE2 domain-containing protein [Blastocatellia bacterium]|nr:CHASE2 domain-containing protein [Blastocatellia bacterium]
MLKRLWLGMLVTLLLMTATKFIETTSLGHRIETFLFEALQSQLPSFDSKEQMAIQVVDMTKIRRGKDQVTLRDALRKTIEAIVAQHPSAVGIDVDFSPGASGWQDDDDPNFFDFCLKLKQDSNVPIFLGVYRTIGERSDTWLGSDKYKALAAALRVDEDTKRLPRWLLAKGSNEKLPMMSAALATSYRPSLPELAWKLSRTVEVTSDNTHGIERRGEDQMLLGLSLINYSKLEEIQRETIFTINPDAIADSERALAGRMVLLGDATEFEDPFPVPGRDTRIAGVYLIASAAYTLAVDPLYELNGGARLTLDLLISILIIVRVEWLRFRYVKVRAGSRFDRAQSRSIWIAIVAVTLIGFLMTRWLNIMWFDFPLIVFALLLHPKVEHRLRSFWRMKKASAKSTS